MSIPAVNAHNTSVSNIVDSSLLAMDDVPPWPPPTQPRGHSMPEWMLSAAQARSNPFATNNSSIADMPAHSTTMSEYQNLSSDVIIDGVNMNTSIVDTSVRLRMVPRHHSYLDLITIH